MKNDSSVDLKEKERETISTWCEMKLDSFKFSTAITQRDNSITTNWDAIYVSFFMRRLDLKHYPNEIYLDMLSFQKWDDDAVDIFDFVKSIVDDNELDVRVISNLKGGIKLFQVLSNHIEYCKARKLKGAAPLLITYFEDPNSPNRHAALDGFVFLSEDLSSLQNSLSKVKDEFKFHIIKILVDKRSNAILTYLITEFNKSSDPSEKLHYSYYLTQLQNLTGIRFYYKYIKRTKEVPMAPEAPYSNFLANLTSLRALPAIFRLHELGFDPEIKQETFSNLRNIAAEALSSVCLHNDNFETAKSIFKVYKIWLWFKCVMRKKEIFKKVNSDLDFYFENMEKQYYINKSSMITFEQAVVVFNDFERIK